MMLDTNMPSPPAAEPVGVAVIETDAFCEGCGFNLHTQKVWRDERLDIAVCRCPECGRHHAAGMRTTAGSAWARRAALAALVMWVVVQIGLAVGIFFMFIGFAAAADDGLVTSDHMTRDGRPVVVRNIAGTNGFEYALGEDRPYNVPASEVVYGKRVAPWLSGQASTSQDYRFATPIQALLIAIVFALLTMAAGVILATISWFWRRGMKWAWLLLPTLSTLLIITIMRQEQHRGTAWSGAPIVGTEVEMNVTAAVGLLLVIGLAIGLAIGLPVARFTVSVFVPPKARQLFAFLWHCDGKTMPQTVEHRR